MTVPGWQLKFTGWPWWLVLPMAVAGIWLLFRLHRHELSILPAAKRKLLLSLRGIALGLLILFFLEPTLTRRTVERVLPAVAVLVDQSGSMAVRDPGPSSGSGAQEAALSRYERAITVARDKIVPALSRKARVKVFGCDTDLTPIDLAKPISLLPNRATDFETVLAALGRNWAQEYVGGILLVSDGRQTRGADPTPVLRSFRARGAMLTGLLVGDAKPPPDAVVAEVSGSSEVFVGENVPLTVRYRVMGAPELDWDLVISHGSEEVARRTVRGNDQWQYETFAFAATNAGVQLYRAHIEMAREQSLDQAVTPSGSVVLEIWKGVGGGQVADLVNNAAFKNKAGSTMVLPLLEYRNRGEQYGGRIRGILVPPQDGNYTFWIGSDDSSELWVSPSLDPSGKSRVASVSGYVPPGTWSMPSQKSQPIPLRRKNPYYFEVLHKQGGGEDYVTVGWQLPDGTVERPIPSSRIATFEESTPAQLAERQRQAAEQRTNSWKEASVANNSAEFPVAVSEDPIKVLLLDSTPRWESRYLSAMFERDRRVSFTRRYHSIIVDDPNLRLLPKDQAEWDSYDMVCMGDLDGLELPPDQQKLLANFVARRGGFLVCLAGPRGLPKAFSMGSMASLLPVRIGGASVGGSGSEGVGVILASQGHDHPITQILNDSGFNQKLWPMLPPLQWIADGTVAKPGATVLLTAGNAGRTPIVAIQRFGAGRVLWMGTEESWRWRDRLGERVHQTFWLQVMRWGLAGRLRGKDASLQVGLDNYLVAPGQAAELKARVARKNPPGQSGPAGAGEPLATPPLVKIEMLPSQGSSEILPAKTMEMDPMRDVPGMWHLPLESLAEGTYRLRTTHPDLAGLEETRELTVRGQTGAEGIELSADPANLSRLASAGGHLSGPVDECDRLVADLAAKLKPRDQERRQTLRLWNNYFALAIVVAALSAEWVLRKRYGLP